MKWLMLNHLWDKKSIKVLVCITIWQCLHWWHLWNPLGIKPVCLGLGQWWLCTIVCCNMGHLLKLMSGGLGEIKSGRTQSLTLCMATLDNTAVSVNNLLGVFCFYTVYWDKDQSYLVSLGRFHFSNVRLSICLALMYAFCRVLFLKPCSWKLVIMSSGLSYKWSYWSCSLCYKACNCASDQDQKTQTSSVYCIHQIMCLRNYSFSNQSQNLLPICPGKDQQKDSNKYP